MTTLPAPAAAVEGPSHGTDRQTTIYSLSNGLRVVIREDHFAPVVAEQIWVQAGGADEDDIEAGVAHVHEHMLFKGTKKRGVGEIASAVESAGGRINAWTSWDQTVYHVVLASRFAEEGLDILADAVRNSTFDPAELDKELAVVAEEWKRGRDSPGNRLFHALFATAYSDHPYKRPVIGTEESIAGLTREKVLDFYRRFYTPSNMTVIVVGDVDSEKVKAQIEDLFGDFAAREPERPQRKAEGPQAETRFEAIAMDVKEAHMALGFHIPAADHEDVPALDLLSNVLGAGESSRLYRRLVAGQIASSASCSAYTPPDPGMFLFTASLEAGDEGRVLEAFLDEIAKVRKEPVSGEELEMARANLESDFVYRRQTVQGQARELGYFVVVHQDPDYDKTYIKQLRSVTVEDLQRVARKYFSAQGLSVVSLMPEDHPGTLSLEAVREAAAMLEDEAATGTQAALENGSAGAKHAAVDLGDRTSDASQMAADIEDETAEAKHAAVALADKDTGAGQAVALADGNTAAAAGAQAATSQASSAAPAGGDASGGMATAEAVPPPTEPLLMELPNGVRVIVQEHHEVPLFSVRATMLGGLLAETRDNNGISNFTADVLTRGTEQRSHEELARAIESLAGQINGFSGRNSIGVAGGFLSEHFDEGLNLILEVLLRPAFREEDVEKSRRELLLAIKNREDDSAHRAFDLLWETAYPDHPYGMTTLGTESSIESLSADDLAAFYQDVLDPSTLVITVVGDVDSSTVKAKLAHALHGLRDDGHGFKMPPPAARPDSVRRARLDSDRHQTHIVVGFPGVDLKNDDRHALSVLETVLARQGGRLFYELRDQQALAYTVTAFSSEGLAPGLFGAYIATDPDNEEKALAGLLEQLDKVRKKEVSSSELQRAQRFLIGSHEISMQTNGAIADTMAFNELYGLGYLEDRKYAEQIRAVTIEDVKRVAEKYLDPSIRSEAVVGPAEGVIYGPPRIARVE